MEPTNPPPFNEVCHEVNNSNKACSVLYAFLNPQKISLQKVENNLALARMSVFHKLLVKVVIYSMVYNYFYQKGPLFCILV